MNNYQKSIDELKFDENAKRRIFHRVSQSWDASREYRLKFERMRTANICLSVFLAIFCVSNVAMAVVKIESEKPDTVYYSAGLDYYHVGEAFEDHDCVHREIGYNSMDGSFYNGSFLWNSISFAKTIQCGETVYRSDKDYFLIIQETLDLDEYSLNDVYNWIEFGTLFYTTSEEGETHNISFTLNFNGDPNDENDCLNVEVTKALSCDIAIQGPPRAARGTVYLCLDISQDLYDALYFNYVAETEGVAGIDRLELPKLLIDAGIPTKERAIECRNRFEESRAESWQNHLKSEEEYKKWLETHENQAKQDEELFKEMYWWRYEREEGEYKQYEGIFTPPGDPSAIQFAPCDLDKHVYLDKFGKRREVGLIFYAFYSDLNFCDSLVI